MANWQKVIAQYASDVEFHFDLLKYRFRERLGGRDPIMIRTYRGFGTSQRIFLKGRVLEDKGIPPADDNDSLWDNLVNTFKRFDSDEIPFARLRARFQGTEQEVETDVEGFFELWIEPLQALPTDRMWHTVELDLLDPLRPGYPPVHAEGQVYVPLPGAQFGVISDIDDTVMQTDAANLLRMARNVFLGNARTRLPFKGVAAFYRALFHGASGNSANPLYYVSSSPWNLYSLLSEFFQLQDIPIGPILFLRDWGLSEEEILPIRHREFKTETIRKILDLCSEMNFILVGDSGQEDPEIYTELVEGYPDRIQAIYIRNVSRDLKRRDAIEELARKVAQVGRTLILAEDTLPMARHAAEQGWISPAALPAIEIEKAADEAPPGPIDRLLGETEEGEAPTVVVQTGEHVEDALKTGEEDGSKTPTVIVEEDDQPE